MMASTQLDTSAEAADQKKRRACDECRTRKLACSKESGGCSRCVREGIACIYSAQKPMGRPRKRPRTDDGEDANVPGTSGRAEPAEAKMPSGGMGGLDLHQDGMANGDVGLSVLADQASSPSFTFFDFLGMGENNIDPFLQQSSAKTTTEETPAASQSTERPNPYSAASMPLPAIASATANAAIPDLFPSAWFSPKPSTDVDSGQICLFPRSLFGASTFDIDFSTASDTALGSNMPDATARRPPHHSHNDADTTSPAPSLASGLSQSAANDSPDTVTAAASQPLECLGPPGAVCCNMPNYTSSHGMAIIPPSPQFVAQKLPNAQHSDAQPPTDPPPTEKAPQARPPQTPEQRQEEQRKLENLRIASTIPTAPTVDAYTKASAAWLLTAPNRVCGCLARLYLALDSLQHLPSEIGPAMSVARNAAHTAHDTILCPSCSPPNPMDVHYRAPLQSYQNLMILGALLPSIAHTYRRIVAMVDDEAARATAAKTRLTISLADYGGVWGHMAHFANVCEQTSELNNSVVEPPLWRLVVRALLKMDVYGMHAEASDVDTNGEGGAPKDGDPQAPLPRKKGKASIFMVPVHFGLKDIAELMESRATLRHQWMDAAYDAGLLKDAESCGGPPYVRLPPGEKHNCQRIIEMAKQEIDRLDIA